MRDDSADEPGEEQGDSRDEDLAEAVSEEDLSYLEKLAAVLDGQAADHARRLVHWRTRAPEHFVWGPDLLSRLPIPRDWERLLVEQWPKADIVPIPLDQAIDLLRLEVDYAFSPGAAEQEWNRQNAPRTCLWGLERRRVLAILEMALRLRRGRSESMPE